MAYKSIIERTTQNSVGIRRVNQRVVYSDARFEQVFERGNSVRDNHNNMRSGAISGLSSQTYFLKRSLNSRTHRS